MPKPKEFAIRGLLITVFLFTLAEPLPAAPPSKGEWKVQSAEVVENKSIVLHANLTVKKGGRLTLRNVDLEMDSPGDIPLGISVEPEGSLSIYDSRIFSDSECGFNFTAGSFFKEHRPKSADLVIKESRLRAVNGLQLNAIDNGEIEGNTVMVNVRGGHTNCIDLHGALNCTLKDNKIQAYPPVSTGAPAPLIGIASARSHFNIITGNHISDTRNGLNLSYSWNNRITENTWIGPIGEPGLKEMVSRWWSVGTTGQMGEVGLYLGPWSNNNTVENNTFLLTNSGIIVVEQSGNNIIARNTAKGGGIGIALLWATDNIIDGNVFADIFREDAIHAFAARDNVIINNSVSSASGGIGLLSSDMNILQGNKISASGRGIFLHASSNNSVEQNSVTATTMPIVLSESSGNTIRMNNLAQDGLQRYDDGHDNSWEANYWGAAAVAPYPVPPNGKDYHPSKTSIPILSVETPEPELMEFKAIPYRESLIEDEVTWQNKTVTLKEGLCVKDGGSLTLRKVRLEFMPLDLPVSFEQGPNPFSITVNSGGSLSTAR